MSRPSRLVSPRLCKLAALPLGLALACCTKTAQPPPPPAAAMPLPLPPPPPLTRPVLRTVWGFDTTPKACTMSARASQASLLMIVRPEGPLRLVVSLPAPAPPHMAAHFAGPAGQWTIAGDGLASGQAVFYLPRNETTLGRILMLLSGGTLELRADTPGLPILSLPESGDAGREWFACARHSVTGL